MNGNHNDPGIRTAPRQGGFTVIELAVIVAVLAVLVILQLPVHARAAGRDVRMQCAGNLRQFALALHVYGNENDGRLPSSSSGFWPWDLPTTASQPLLRYGMSRNLFYCPANPAQNSDAFWNYSSGYRIIGYSMAFSSSSIISTNWNLTATPQSIPSSGPVPYPPPLPSQRLLLADVIISAAGQNNPAVRSNYQYTGISGGTAIQLRTSHLTGRLPSGANVGMLDGQVEWRRPADVLPRTDPASVSPVFWW